MKICYQTGEWLQDNEINEAPDVTHKSCKKDSLL